MTTALHLTIITGASRGLGLAMALQRRAEGHAILGLARRPSTELDIADTARGAPCEQWAVDLADAGPVAARLHDWLAKHGADGLQSVTLINNAGLLPRIAPLGEIGATELAEAMRVDLEAPMLLTGSFLRATASWHGCERKVLNVSSGLGRRAMASQAAYCAAKAGMDHFTRCVALEEALKPHGAKLCSLAPGVIDTDMQVQLRGADAASFPDHQAFVGMKTSGQLTGATDAAANVLAYLDRADYGANPVADVRG